MKKDGQAESGGIPGGHRLVSLEGSRRRGHRQSHQREDRDLSGCHLGAARVICLRAGFRYGLWTSPCAADVGFGVFADYLLWGFLKFPGNVEDVSAVEQDRVLVRAAFATFPALEAELRQSPSPSTDAEFRPHVPLLLIF